MITGVLAVMDNEVDYHPLPLNNQYEVLLTHATQPQNTVRVGMVNVKSIRVWLSPHAAKVIS